MAEESTEFIPIGEMAKALKISKETVKQLCETGQIHKGCYVIRDRGTVWESYWFEKKEVLKVMKPKKTTK